jgi:hypothetical protein
MIGPMVMQHFSDLLKIHSLATYRANFIRRTNAVGLAIHAPRASASVVIRLMIDLHPVTQKTMIEIAKSGIGRIHQPQK